MLNIELLEKIKKTNKTTEKIFLAVNGFTQYEHKYLTRCFDRTIYGISKTNIAKAIGYDKSHYGTFEDLGEFLQIHKNGGFDILENGCARYDFSYIDMFLEAIQITSGNQQIDELQRLLSYVIPEYRPYYIRVLLKNPRLNINLTTYNKIRAKQKLQPIKEWYVKLASLLKPEEFSKLSYPVVAETKIDGERAVITIKDNKAVSIISRAGNDITQQFPEIVNKLNNTFASNYRKVSCVLDGEIATKTFNALQKRMNRLKENLNTDYDLEFYCFDIIEYENENLIYKDLVQRRKILESIYAFFNPEFKLTNYTIINNIQELDSFYQTNINNKEEGIMVKTLDSKWAIKKNDRVNWFKVKPVYTADLEIYDAKYGNGRNKDVINIIYVRDKFGVIKTKVSSGFSDSDRELLTQLYKNDKLIGRIVEIKYNQLTDTNSLRHPRFVRFREDKDEADEKLI